MAKLVSANEGTRTFDDQLRENSLKTICNASFLPYIIHKEVDHRNQSQEATWGVIALDGFRDPDAPHNKAHGPDSTNDSRTLPTIPEIQEETLGAPSRPNDSDVAQPPDMNLVRTSTPLGDPRRVSFGGSSIMGPSGDSDLAEYEDASDINKAIHSEIREVTHKVCLVLGYVYFFPHRGIFCSSHEGGYISGIPRPHSLSNKNYMIC